MIEPLEAEIPIPAKPRRRIGWIISVILLGLALLAALTILALTYLRLEEARDVIEEQEELIDKKETFSSAMGDLVGTMSEFAGTRLGALIPQGRYNSLANRGWDHRWNAEAIDQDTAAVRKADDELAAVLSAARDQAASNASGTIQEAVIDSLGGGFVTSALDDADTLCETDVVGCVDSADPYVVHFDAKDIGLPWMTDWQWQGIAYHEFAHVLQITNPTATKVPLDAFGGDGETMADCFALTYLDGWTLDHTVWVSDFEYWEVSLGYGYTCDESQRQVIRDWYEGLGYAPAPIAQSG